MKTKIILTSAIITALLFISSLSFGQGCCGSGGSCKKSSSNSASMNERAVKQAGKYKIEMVYQPLYAKDPLTFYLTNKKGKSLSNQGVTAKAEITYSDGTTETDELKPIGENGFAIPKMQIQNQSFVCLVTFQINGENVTTRFEEGNKKQTPATATTYTCPMHPEVQTAQPGGCPKCGMALVKN